MNRTKFLSLLASGAAGAFAGGCENTKPGPVVVRDVFPTDQIRAEDRIVIVFNDVPSVAGGSQLAFDGAVPDDGTIALPYNKSVSVKGRTTTEVQQAIKPLYVPSIWLTLSPVVRIQERYFFVYGEVRQSGRFTYTQDLTVLKAIATAGGFTDFADRTEIELTIFNGKKHTINGKVAEKNPAYDLKVLPGEKVHVRRRFS